MLKRRKIKFAGDVNSASMSDIAFLLLIFFLVTTIFAVERGIPMLLPGDGPVKKVSRKNLVTVHVYPNGTVTLDNHQIPLSQIRHDVAEYLELNEKLIVVIESHPDSEYGMMVEVLDELRLAQANRVTLREMEVARGGL
jgi:biopolymer transport protein ExbD